MNKEVFMVRKRLSTQLQMPRQNVSPGQYLLTINVECASAETASRFDAHLALLYHPPPSQPVPRLRLFPEWEQLEQKKPEVRTWRTDDAHHLRVMTKFKELMTCKGFGAMKLFKASRKQRGEVTAMLLPPAQAIHRTRNDGTDALKLTCNLGVYSKVSSTHHLLCSLTAQHVHDAT
eukprot:6200944-Pleurochrysis_carterae.AAC.1